MNARTVQTLKYGCPFTIAGERIYVRSNDELWCILGKTVSTMNTNRTFGVLFALLALVAASVGADDATQGTAATTSPRGDFVRYVLTLDKGFVATNSTTDEPLIVHLPCRAGKFAPEGWCIEPGANVIGIVDATDLELAGGKIGGKVHMVPWEARVSREYELEGTVGKSGIAGTFTLRQTMPDRNDPIVFRGNFTGRVSSEEELARGNELAPGKQYPMWRGPIGSGNSESGRKLVLSPANARLAWLSEDLIPQGAWNIATKGLSGGCDNVCVEDGRAYLVYYVPSGDVVGKDADLDKPRPEYTAESWRLHWLVEADDVVHCIDVRTGATLWKTAFARTGLNTNGRDAGLKITPHRTVCVADGKAFAVGSIGDLFCMDAVTGRELWRSALPRAKKLGAELRETTIRDRVVAGMSILTGHPVYADGVLVCGDPGGTVNGRKQVSFVQGFDAATGKHLWTYGLRDGFYIGSMSVVSRWVHQGRAYPVAAGAVGAVCLDPRTGKPLWRLEEAIENARTVALDGDYLVTGGHPGNDLRGVEWEEGRFQVEFTKTPMRCYRLSLSGATKLWELPQIEYYQYCVGLIRDGHLYLQAKGAVAAAEDEEPSPGRKASLVCIALDTGKVVASIVVPAGGGGDSAVGGDGIFSAGWSGTWQYGLFRADPADLRILPSLQMPRKPHYTGWLCAPAYADGRLFVRSWDRLACYDLRLDERIAKAADALGRGDSAAAVGLFVDACRDPEASVRREAVAGLGGMGDKATEAFDVLVGLVRGDIASSVRTAAIGALAPVSRKQPDRVIELVRKGDHPNVRAGAVTALAGFDTSNGKVVEAVVEGLDDKAPVVRFAALRTLGAWKTAAAPAAARLARMVRDEDGTPADDACVVLKAIGKAGAVGVPALVEAFRSPNLKRQERAVTALTAIGASSVGKMVELVGDQDRATAMRAMAFLCDLGAEAADALPALRSSMQGKDWSRAAAASSALVSIAAGEEQAVCDVMVKRLSETRTNVVAEAAAILARIAKRTGDDKRRQEVVRALTANLSGRVSGGDELAGRAAGGEFKRVLVRALGDIGPAAKSAVPILEKMAVDPVLSNEIAETLQKIAPGNPLPRPKLDEKTDLDFGT